MDNICTICFENDHDKNFCLLFCNHKFHFECLQEWILTLNKDSPIHHNYGAKCPYCRQYALIKELPDNYDAFYKFYFFTKFVRKKCRMLYCEYSEFPLNEGECSFHKYPIIDKHELKIIMDEIFCFYFLPLKMKKLILHLVSFCYENDLVFSHVFTDFKKLLVDLLLSESFNHADIYNEMKIFLTDKSYYVEDSSRI